MIEALVVFALVGLLVGLGVLAVSLSLEALLLTAVGCVGAGFVVGVTAGVYYHLALYRCLAKRGPVPRTFVWNPTRYHALLQPEELSRITPWFVIGACGFGVILVGSALFMLAMLRI